MLSLVQSRLSKGRASLPLVSKETAEGPRSTVGRGPSSRRGRSVAGGSKLVLKNNYVFPQVASSPLEKHCPQADSREEAELLWTFLSCSVWLREERRRRALGLGVPPVIPQPPRPSDSLLPAQVIFSVDNVLQSVSPESHYSFLRRKRKQS